MIVSHKHRFIFFAVPKTATHTIREALRAHKDSDDWEQQMLFGKQSLPIPEIARIGHGHISARQLRAVLDEDTWNGYFKFAFVRNPFDRYISTCFFLNRDNPRFADHAESFLKGALSRPRFRQRILVTPQAEQLTDESGAVALDYVGRYESLQQSYDEICEHIGIERTDLGRKNVSDHKKYVEYYDDQLESTVRDFYRADFETFDYESELALPTN